MTPKWRPLSLFTPIKKHSNILNIHKVKRVSFYPVKEDKKGSITVEAAVTVPLFFLAVSVLFYMLEVMAIRTTIRDGMQYTTKKVAEEVYIKPMVSTGNLEHILIEAIGSERLERSIVLGGSSGLHCEKSRLWITTGIFEMNVDYQIQLPLKIFGIPPAKIQETMKVKGWNGYQAVGFDGSKDDTVYVTETGMVFHKDYHCNYLDLSIHAVDSDKVDVIRNKEQEKYYPCEYCGKKETSGGVYITDYGNRYHYSLTCGGLKRTIYAIPRSEAVGKGECSKCCK